MIGFSKVGRWVSSTPLGLPTQIAKETALSSVGLLMGFMCIINTACDPTDDYLQAKGKTLGLW